MGWQEEVCKEDWQMECNSKDLGWQEGDPKKEMEDCWEEDQAGFR